jgi:hypothetical protein
MALAALPLAARADVLDQQQTDHRAQLFVSGPASSRGQTLLAQAFTAGLSGPLDRIELYLAGVRGQTLAFVCASLKDTSNGAPGTTLLARACVESSEVPAAGGWVKFAFSPAPHVNAGQQYAIVVAAAGQDVYVWHGSLSPGAYSGGRSFVNCSSDTQPQCHQVRPATWTPTPSGAHQLAFRTYLAFKTIGGCEIRARTICRHAQLAGADLSSSDLEGADLFHANLSDSVLADARLGHANLAYAALSNSVLVGVWLWRADLRKADLRDASLFRANLQGADLQGAVLDGADLRKADLRGADLRDAVLRNADLAEADLRDARLCRTIMPDGRADNLDCR